MDKVEPSGSTAVEVSHTATAARQAVAGHGVRYVLAWSLAGVLVALVIVLVTFFWR